jgi:hypothetical protein
MRLKQLRVMFVLALFMCAMAAADSQMTGVNVDSIDNNASTITIRANGPFVHNEYRPSDNLLLVDLAGVALGRLDSKLHPVNLPGLVSYRVTSYTGTQGNVVARVEIGLQPHTTVHLQDQSGALQIKVKRSLIRRLQVRPCFHVQHRLRRRPGFPTNRCMTQRRL